MAPEPAEIYLQPGVQRLLIFRDKVNDERSKKTESELAKTAGVIDRTR